LLRKSSIHAMKTCKTVKEKKAGEEDNSLRLESQTRMEEDALRGSDMLRNENYRIKQRPVSF